MNKREDCGFIAISESFDASFHPGSFVERFLTGGLKFNSRECCEENDLVRIPNQLFGINTGYCLIDERKEISPDTTAWLELPRGQSY